MASSSPQAQALIGRALKSSTFAVVAVPTNNPRRIGYAIVDPKNPTVAIHVGTSDSDNSYGPSGEWLCILLN